MSLGAEMMEDIAVDAAVYSVIGPTHWRMRNGKLIAISDMTDTHLKNTIAMLHRQIDGSAHDDFCWDNITAMQNELKRRNNNGRKNHKR